jgi:hypothetical protein
MNRNFYVAVNVWRFGWVLACQAIGGSINEGAVLGCFLDESVCLLPGRESSLRLFMMKVERALLWGGQEVPPL